jgi:hypothetical protein
VSDPLLDATAIMALLVDVADDLEALWPHCSFGTPEAATAAYEEAYPDETPDPNLADWIAGLI